MSTKTLASFSNSGRYYAHISDDGKLRIWDVHSGTLKQEYTPDIHLTSPFTELQWITTSTKAELKAGNRKRKSSLNSAVSESEYLLLGSKSSDIFLYSISSYSIISTFKNGHTSRINSITWCRNQPSVFFSCSDDLYVAKWDIESYSVNRKWKCGKVSCIIASDDGHSIVTAKRELKLWNISDEKEINTKTFIGHSTDVVSLAFARICDEPCVLSAACGSRYISAWLLDADSVDRSAFATFSMDDALNSLSVFGLPTGGVCMLVSSKTGVLQVYQFTKNGKKHTKPVKPILSLQIAEENNQEKSQVDQIPIISATFCDENSAYIAYGTDNILSFEKQILDSSEKCIFIVRQHPKKKLYAKKEESVSKILPTSTTSNVQYVPPDAVNGFFPTCSSRKGVKRGNNSEIKLNEVALEQRLENLLVDVPSTTCAPSSDSLVHLLLQGLKSKDSKILQDVLLSKDEKIIRTTVNRLPVDAIKPLSLELISMLQNRRSESDAAVKWLRCILLIHAAHLLSSPDVTEIFAPVFPFIESRLNVVGPMYRLIGRLDMMIEQIKQRTEAVESLQNVTPQPKFIYQDEDSDDEEDNNEVLKEESESNDDSDDHWDEISEIDDDSGHEQGSDVDMDTTDL